MGKKKERNYTVHYFGKVSRLISKLQLTLLPLGAALAGSESDSHVTTPYKTLPVSCGSQKGKWRLSDSSPGPCCGPRWPRVGETSPPLPPDTARTQVSVTNAVCSCKGSSFWSCCSVGGVFLSSE